jgi:hypothetical protein
LDREIDLKVQILRRREKKSNWEGEDPVPWEKGVGVKICYYFEDYIYARVLRICIRVTKNILVVARFWT